MGLVSVAAGGHGLLPGLHSKEAWALKNTMPAVMTYMLAASARDIGTCPMEGFDATAVMTAIGGATACARQRYVPAVAVATGYAADETAHKPSPRFDLADLVSMDHVDAPYSE